MASVYCRPCTLGARKRAPNQATHLTFYADGSATLTCRRHTEQALNFAGTFAFPVDLGAVITPEQCTPQELRRALMIGHVARTGERSLVLDEDDDAQTDREHRAAAG